jgi:DNA-binding transcriptional ArsR family regulator
MAFSLYHDRITAIREDTRLSDFDRLFYILLLNICIGGERGDYHESTRDIASATGMSGTTVYNALGALSRAGYITTTKRKRQEGSGHEIWYIVIPGLAQELAVPISEIHVGNVTIFVKVEIDEGEKDERTHLV